MANDELEKFARQKVISRVQAGRAFEISTPQTKLLLQQLYHWLQGGSSGGVICGSARLGKTLAVRWALKQLQGLIGGVPWVEVPFRDVSTLGEREFFSYILLRSNHRFTSGSASDLRDRVTNFLATRAKRSVLNCFILFVDEAQNLQRRHYAWLVNIQNELAAEGCNLLVLLVGQPELLARRDALIEKGEEFVLGRFFLHEHEFSGMRTMEEVRSCFEQFDNVVYPVEGGLRFPMYFAPLAVSTGFTLADLAPAAWERFSAIAGEAGLKGTIVPMTYLCRAVANLLLDLAAEDAKGKQICHDLLASSIDKSGYALSVKISARIKRPPRRA